MLTAMDSSVDPCDDFFEFACGSWNKINIIPEDSASYNTFSKLGDDIKGILKGSGNSRSSSSISSSRGGGGGDSWNKINVIPDNRVNYNTFSELRDDIKGIVKSGGGTTVVVVVVIVVEVAVASAAVVVVVVVAAGTRSTSSLITELITTLSLSFTTTSRESLKVVVVPQW